MHFAANNVPKGSNVYMFKKIFFLLCFQFIANIAFAGYGDVTTDVMPLNVYFPAIYGNSYSKSVLIPRCPLKELHKDVQFEATSCEVLEKEMMDLKLILEQESTELIEKRLKEHAVAVMAPSFQWPDLDTPFKKRNTPSEKLNTPSEEQNNPLKYPPTRPAPLVNDDYNNVYNQLRKVKNDVFSICNNRKKSWWGILLDNEEENHFFKVFVFFMTLVRNTVETIIYLESENKQNIFDKMVVDLGNIPVNYIEGSISKDGGKTNTIKDLLSGGEPVTISQLVSYGYSNEKKPKIIYPNPNSNCTQKLIAFSSVSLLKCDVGLAYLSALSYAMVYLYQTKANIHQLNAVQDLLMDRFFQKSFFNKLGMLGIKNYDKEVNEFRRPESIIENSGFCCGWCGYQDYIVKYPSVPMPTHEETCYFVILKSVFTAGFQVLSAGRTSGKLQADLLDNMYELALNCAPKNVSEIVEKALKSFSDDIQKQPSLLWNFMVHSDELKNSNSDLRSYYPKVESVKEFIACYCSNKGYYFGDGSGGYGGSVQPVIDDYRLLLGEKVTLMQEIFKERNRLQNSIASIREKIDRIESFSKNTGSCCCDVSVQKKRKLDINSVTDKFKLCCSSSHDVSSTSTNKTSVESVFSVKAFTERLKGLEDKLSCLMREYNASLECNCLGLNHDKYKLELSYISDEFSRLDVDFEQRNKLASIKEKTENELKLLLDASVFLKSVMSKNTDIADREMITAKVMSLEDCINEISTDSNACNNTLLEWQGMWNRTGQCVNTFNSIVEEIPKAQISKIKSENAENVKYKYYCAICLMDGLDYGKVGEVKSYPEPKTMIRTKCKHIFCITCFQEWVSLEKYGRRLFVACPMCRGQIKIVPNENIVHDRNLDSDGVYQLVQ
ncbi:MAG: hypothetical protein QS721_05570 [Candidatus Endonucleobacter sp. (ex Gigantidas childressi)]|nr:hypothetical protein [Candidatus Endonucleobacter sp. (ex Gigantidas childressi)]